MKTNLISKSETSEILKKITSRWKINFPKIKNLKIHQIENDVQIITAKDLMILEIGDVYLPFLSQNSLLEKF